MPAEFIKLYQEHTDQKKLSHIADCLRKGGLVIFPTDTVYSIGCDITNKRAVEKVAAFKGATIQKAPLSFICSDLKNLSDHVAQIETKTFKILKRSLPGAYTFILPHNNTLPNIFRKKKSVGIRIPDNTIPRQLVEHLGNPLVSTSIKKETEEVMEYITNPELIFERYQHKVDIVIDGGISGFEPSTVIDITSGEPELIREGKGDLFI